MGGLGLRVQDPGLRRQGFGFWILGFSGFGVQVEGLGFRIQCVGAWLGVCQNFVKLIGEYIKTLRHVTGSAEWMQGF